jgi:hypothetical protein
MDAIAVVHPWPLVAEERRRPACNHFHQRHEIHTSPTRSQQGTREMSNKLTIAIGAALLLAAAASVGSAAGSRAPTTDAAISAVCSELPPLPQASHCGSHCQHFNISDRTLGPTFPTACRQTT